MSRNHGVTAARSPSCLNPAAPGEAGRAEPLFSVREHPPWQESRGKTTGCWSPSERGCHAGIPAQLGKRGSARLINFFFFFSFLNQDYTNFQGLMESSCDGEATLQ